MLRGQILCCILIISNNNNCYTQKVKEMLLEVMGRFMAQIVVMVSQVSTYLQTHQDVCIHYAQFFIYSKKQQWGRDTGHFFRRVGGSRMRLAWECDLSLLWIWSWDGYSLKTISREFSMTVHGCRNSLTWQAKVRWTRNLMGAFCKEENQWEHRVSQITLIITQTIITVTTENSVGSKTETARTVAGKQNKQTNKKQRWSIFPENRTKRERKKDGLQLCYSI